MATEKKGVMVYLPRDVEEVLEKYCTENNITRKNKDGEPMPSMGTGIVQYLKSQLLGIAPSNAPSNGLSRDEVLEMIRGSATGIAPSNGLSRDEVLEAIKPLQDDLAKLGQQFDRLEAYTELGVEARKLVKRLEADPDGFWAAAKEAIDQGRRGGKLADELKERGYGAKEKDGTVKPFDPAVASHLVTAIEFLNKGFHSTQKA